MVDSISFTPPAFGLISPWAAADGPPLRFRAKFWNLSGLQIIVDARQIQASLALPVTYLINKEKTRSGSHLGPELDRCSVCRSYCFSAPAVPGRTGNPPPLTFFAIVRGCRGEFDFSFFFGPGGAAAAG